MVTNLHVCVSVWSIIIVYHSLCTDVPSAPVIMNHSTFCKNLSVSWFPDKFSNIVSYTIVVVNSTEAILTTLNFPGEPLSRTSEVVQITPFQSQLAILQDVTAVVSVYMYQSASQQCLPQQA